MFIIYYYQTKIRLYLMTDKKLTSQNGNRKRVRQGNQTLLVVQGRDRLNKDKREI